MKDVLINHIVEINLVGNKINDEVCDLLNDIFLNTKSLKKVKLYGKKYINI
jgi:hypothetical protein